MANADNHPDALPDDNWYDKFCRRIERRFNTGCLLICFAAIPIMTAWSFYRDGHRDGSKEGYEKCLNDHGFATITTVVSTGGR
jgi:hypothetical protein